MSDGAAERPSVFTIPTHRSFADALVAGLVARHGKDPLALARGRILLPNNRAVRTVTEAFVRASGGGLLLPRLIPVGDPEIDDRIGGALDPADQARTLDALRIEEVEPSRLKDAVAETDELARHWQVSLAKLELIYEAWPGILAGRGAIDLAERRNRLLHRMTERWRRNPPRGFTVAAGITTAAPAVAALLGCVARMPEGLVILPG